MFSKKPQPNIVQPPKRIEPSGFIVDLRQKVNQEIKREAAFIDKKADKSKIKLARIEEKLARKMEKEFEVLENKAKKIKPNLLRLGQEPAHRKKKPSQSFFSRFQNFQISWRLTEERSLWSRVFENEAKKFKKAARLNVKKNKQLSELENRVAVAETKAIWYRSIFSFVLVLILIIVPLKLLSYFEFLDLGGLEKKILGRSQLALNNLLAATDAATKMDFVSADSEFQNAGNNFLAAQEELNKINDSLLSLASLSSDPKLKLAAESKKFLQAGTIISSFGRNLVLATDSLFGGDKESFSVSLDRFTYYGGLAVNDAKNLEKELSKINPANLPSQYQEKFLSITKQTGLLADNLESFVAAASKFKDVLGATQDKRYLLVFQNNSELRASGGFLGSYALVDIRDGKIRNLEVPGGGSYDTEGGMNVRVVAPKPLWLVNPLWHFWDANWWPDWPTTAKNLMWFYEKSDGPTVDGVISVTPTVIERLLEITGPIDLTAEYGLTIDSNNFWETVQKIVEQKNLAKTNPEAIIGVPATSTPLQSILPLKQGLTENSANKPKKIIGDLMAKILETLPKKLNKGNLVKILALFENSLSEKQVLFYFTDPPLESEAAKRNWAGEIKDTARDYLLVVNTNIAGQKSDRKMTEKIEHFSEVAEDGSITDTVQITRTHTGVKNEPMTGVRNVDWLRIYVPQDSELLLAEGFKSPENKYFDEKPDPSWEENQSLEKENRALIDENSGTKVYTENNKTVFANWAMVDPGESVVLTVKYRLPFSFLDRAPESNWLTKINAFLNSEQVDLTPYSFMVQKQPGAKASEFTSRLSLPKTWSVFWRYPENLIGEAGWEISDQLDADKYWSVLIKK